MKTGQRFNPYDYMGINIPGLILKNKELSPLSKLILAWTSWISGAEGRENCSFSIEELAYELGVTEEEIISAIQQLERKGYLITEKTKRKSQK